MSFLSPVNQARWARFRHNRRGYLSLWLFMILFVFSLCAELIANDRPLLVQYRGSLYVPALKNYSETTFGGPFATAADYQDPWLQKQLDDNGWILWGADPIWRHHHRLRHPNALPFSPLDEKLAGYRCQRRRRAGPYFIRHANIDSVRACC
ncbi:Inner membrane ABC transporter permease protein yejE [Raoultella planticola]|uniref:Inner membrane ABC transporter permease protein yejE n=1 Tax=Raoultella planticola TaxID=575 RepID=A0A485AFS6_RAOPL|nr:Inner membrane ABC transporter permease protein yejE [Raoultella planticola]